MLAGVLTRFGMGVFISMPDQLILVLPMFTACLLFKRVAPRFVVSIVSVLGGLAALFDLFRFDALILVIAGPVFTMPTFSVPVLLSVGVPLFLVTMASRNIAGIALFGTVTSSLRQAMADDAWREAALITFVVTLSGVTLFDVGSALRGLLAGGSAMLLLGRNAWMSLLERAARSGSSV